MNIVENYKREGGYNKNMPINYYSTLFSPHSLPSLLFYFITLLFHCSFISLLFYFIALLFHYSFISLLFYFTTILLYHSILQFFYFYSSWVCSKIQFPINSRASGEIVSSIFAYSEGDPVLAVWNKWLRPGSSLTM